MRRITTAGLVLVALSGVAGAVAIRGGGAGQPDSPPRTVAASGVVGAALAPQPAGGVTAAAADLPAAPAARVVRTADIGLRVGGGHLRPALDVIRAVAQRAGGYVASSQMIAGGGHAGLIVLRVPAARFTAVLAQVERVGSVRSESVAGQDVSGRFVDLTARLVNAQAQRRVLLGLMTRATTIAESIAVENQLQGVELRIEELQGDLRYLRNQTSMATVAVTVAEARPAPPAPAGTIPGSFRRSLHAAEAVIAAVVIGAGFVLPSALFVLGAYGLWRALRRASLTRRPATGVPPGEA
ncbi:MAG TPA: DUF4349 domain-containing protein [Gaiellales bacterium]|nr:DUF4349 domain-containing protein [Gaiellales bacterium]